MAMAWVFSVAIIFFTFAGAAASLSDSVYHPSITFVNSTSSRNNAMILPLFFKQRNNKEGFHSRRHLQARSIANARMPLHDDLLLNGYYTTRVWIGTPPQRFALIVDTGSTVTYVPCATCEQCGKHQDPKFQPESSSTYKPLKCKTDCVCDSERVECIYERQYAEMSSSSGVLGVDIISFGNQSDLKPQRATFGCENRETGALYSQNADGIMGLGRGDLSIMDQLVKKGVVSNSFSLCYGGMDVGGGAMVLGGISPPNDMVFTPSDPLRRLTRKPSPSTEYEDLTLTTMTSASQALEVMLHNFQKFFRRLKWYLAMQRSCCWPQRIICSDIQRCMVRTALGSSRMDWSRQLFWGVLLCRIPL